MALFYLWFLFCCAIAEKIENYVVWKNRNMLEEQLFITRSKERCSSRPEYYHFLETQDGSFVEFCGASIVVLAGSRPKFNTTSEKIYTKRCNKEHYEPRSGYSNSYRYTRKHCSRLKSRCDGKGEITCGNGTTMEDRSCRCKFEDGWALSLFVFTNYRQTTCIVPSKVKLKCVHKSCQEGYKLDQVYRCVKAQRVTEETIELNSTLREQVDVEADTTISLYLVISLGSVSGCLFIFCVILLCRLRRYKSRIYDRADQGNTGQDHHYDDCNTRHQESGDFSDDSHAYISIIDT